tara:strand:+ start:8559 stop:9029 length:471 start_codon:yes stop_codon:yes gene_type:complete
MSREIKEATPELAREIIPLLREDTIEEISAIYGTGDDVLLSHFARAISRANEAYIAYADDKPICIIGYWTSSFGSPIAHPWVFCTKFADDYPIEFFFTGRKYVETLLEKFDVLTNHVNSDNVRAIRWLKLMGFKVSRDTAFTTRYGVAFRKYEMRK